MFAKFKKEKQYDKRKQTIHTIALILLLTLTTYASTTPTVNATNIEIKTYAYIDASPNLAGVGQNIVVTYRIDKVSPTAMGTSGGDHFSTFTVTITLPDGTTKTEGPFTADSTSSGYFVYTPTAIGNYELQVHFGGQTILNNTYLPSDSAKIGLVVQATPPAGIADNPLPTGYWTTPIYGENKGWYQIADNWLMQGYDYLSRTFGSGNAAVSPYSNAPNSAHVLWSEPLIYGGIVGGAFGDKTYYQGLSYEQQFAPLVLNGKIIFTEAHMDSATVYQTRCVDLYTGKDAWVLNNTNILCAQVLEIDNPNEHGALAYLWSSPSGPNSNATFNVYDAVSARLEFTVTNVTFGGTGGFGTTTTTFGPNGELLSYYIDGAHNWMTLWNSTKAIYRQWLLDTWSPAVGTVYDGSQGIEWNVTLIDVPGVQSITTIGDGYVMAQYADNSVTPSIYEQMAYDVSSMTKDSSGKYPAALNYMWIQNRTDIYESFYLQTNIGNGIYALYDNSQMRFHAYSITTGQEIWVTEPFTSGFASFNWEWCIANGLLYEAGYDGYVRAYNITNGALVWQYYFGSSYESAYGTYPVYSGFTIADGKLYITNDEHSPDAIPWRGGKLWCFDAYNGTLLWDISGKLRNGAVSNGYFVALNSLDGKIYTFGSGNSATTVEAPLTMVPLGTGITITGTVTDQSPGQTCLGIPAAGTPAISDDCMTAWMEYLYEQRSKPTNATGVPVHLTAIDPNGNVQDIDTVLSSADGTYAVVWTPPIPGLYHVTATFEGSNSYYPSSGATYFLVGEAPSAAVASSSPPATTATPAGPTQTPPQTAVPSASPSEAPQPSTSKTPTTTYIAVAVAVVVVVAAAAALALRKRK